MSAVTLLGGVHHAVDITGAGRRPPRRWIGSFPVSAVIRVQEKGNNRQAFINDLGFFFKKEKAIM